jgi:hypothetical protein
MKPKRSVLLATRAVKRAQRKAAKVAEREQEERDKVLLTHAFQRLGKYRGSDRYRELAPAEFAARAVARAAKAAKREAKRTLSSEETVPA